MDRVAGARYQGLMLSFGCIGSIEVFSHLEFSQTCVVGVGAQMRELECGNVAVGMLAMWQLAC